MAQQTYTASEAARALGISLDTLRRWDRQGRIRVRRDAANRRVVPAKEVERLRAREPQGLSARNRFPGVVRSVRVEGLLAQVRIAVTEPVEITAIVTDDLPRIDKAPRYSFAGSDQLALQLQEGAPADVYAAASPKLPELLYRNGLLEKPVVFATNRLVVIVPRSNSGHVSSVYDLRRS